MGDHTKEIRERFEHLKASCGAPYYAVTIPVEDVQWLLNRVAEVRHMETFAAHRLRTHHGKYSVDVARDWEIARKVLGREPLEDDRYVGFVKCEECGELLLG